MKTRHLQLDFQHFPRGKLPDPPFWLWGIPNLLSPLNREVEYILCPPDTFGFPNYGTLRAPMKSSHPSVVAHSLHPLCPVHLPPMSSMKILRPGIHFSDGYLKM